MNKSILAETLQMLEDALRSLGYTNRQIAAEPTVQKAQAELRDTITD